MNLLPHLPFWAELLVFVASAVTIWVAGIFLSNNTDVLADRLHLGQALGGLILLAVATNLPEIAITYSAAASGQLDVAISNILGGIAVQTVVLVALDAFGVRQRRPLTYQAASLTLVIEGAVVLAVLVAVVMGTQLPKTLIRFRLTPDVVLIAIVWVVGLLLTQRAGSKLPWKDSGEAPDSQPEPRGHSQTKHAQAATRQGVSTARAALVFGVAALATLVAGALAEESGIAAADHVGLSGVLFGATVLAAATSLPELSTGLTSVREGDYKLAFGDIFGGNAFLPVLFLLAVLVSGKAVLPNAHASDIYLTGLGGLLTVVYMGWAAVPTRQGTRPARHRQHRRPGPVRRRSHRARRTTPIGPGGRCGLPRAGGGQRPVTWRWPRRSNCADRVDTARGARAPTGDRSARARAGRDDHRVRVALATELVAAARRGRCRRLPALRPAALWQAPRRHGDRVATRPIRPGAGVTIAALSAAAGGALLAFHALTPPALQFGAGLLNLLPEWSVLIAGAGYVSLTAAVEEVLFRGVILSHLTAVVGSWLALAVQAAGFGVLHLHGYPYGPIGVALATGYDLLLGVMRLRSGGLLACWVAHVLADSIIFVFILQAAARPL